MALRVEYCGNRRDEKLVGGRGLAHHCRGREQRELCFLDSIARSLTRRRPRPGRRTRATGRSSTPRLTTPLAPLPTTTDPYHPPTHLPTHHPPTLVDSVVNLASFHLQRLNKGPLESSYRGAHDQLIIPNPPKKCHMDLYDRLCWRCPLGKTTT